MCNMFDIYKFYLVYILKVKFKLSYLNVINNLHYN